MLLKPTKISVQFKSSIVWALLTSLILFLGCFVILTLVKVKRSNDLIHHSINQANLLVSLPFIQNYLKGLPEALLDNFE